MSIERVLSSFIDVIRMSDIDSDQVDMKLHCSKITRCGQCIAPHLVIFATIRRNSVRHGDNVAFACAAHDVMCEVTIHSITLIGVAY